MRPPAARCDLVLVLAGALLCACDTAKPPSSADATAPVARAPAPVADAGLADAAKPKKRLVLHAARALVPKTGALIAPAWVEIEGESITRVSSTAPADAAAARELGDATLMPGLIDAHTHLLHLEAIDADGSSMVSELALMSDADRALRGTTYAREMLASGFTTVRDLGNSGRSGDVALKRAIAKGWVVGPTMLVSTRALAPPGGQFPRGMAVSSHAMIEQEYAVVRTPDEARARVREAFFEGADLIKLIVDHGPGRTMTFDEVKAAVETAHASKKKVAAHVLTAKAAEVAVAAGVDSCDHGYELSDATLAEMAKKKIYLVPTDYPLDFYLALAAAAPMPDTMVDGMKKMRAGSIDRLKRARAARVPIAAGSDAYAVTAAHDRGKEAALIFRAYAESGMSPLEIVQSATTNAADLLGLPENTTAMEAGSPADVIGVRGDPTKDAAALAEIVFVAKRGRPIELPRD